MAQQIACMISGVEKVNGVWQPTFYDNLQAGEGFSGSIRYAPDGTELQVEKDFIPSVNDADTALGLTILYARADETRIALADSLPAYHVIWKQYTEPDENGDYSHGRELLQDELDPNNNMTTPELSAILTHLASRTGYAPTAISRWIINKFNVQTQQQAVQWATSRPRYMTVAKLMQAFRLWSQAKSELDALD